jgi:hypothetical protein
LTDYRIGKEYAPGKNCVDKIDEQTWWNEVMKEINEISLESADELQEDTEKPYTKYYTNGTKAYDLEYKEAPPTRLLSQVLVVSYWLGYHDADKGHYLHDEEIGAWKRIKAAYETGKAAHPMSKSGTS